MSHFYSSDTGHLRCSICSYFLMANPHPTAHPHSLICICLSLTQNLYTLSVKFEMQNNFEEMHEPCQQVLFTDPNPPHLKGAKIVMTMMMLALLLLI